MDPQKALESLLLSMFSADELRRFLRYLPEGDALTMALPGQPASPMVTVHGAVELLASHGYLTGADLWDRISAERPRRKAEVDKVRALFKQPAPPTSAPPALASVTGTPSVLKIVFASASPSREVRLRVDTEFRQVIDKLRGTRHRDRLQVVQVTALRFEDLRTALMEHEPHILHLSCHGQGDGSLIFESAAEDGPQIIPKKNLLKLLRALGSNLRLVVFNACYSAEVARDVPPTVGLSIGMDIAVYDNDAIAFTVAFYETLAFGRSVQTAFDTALAGLDEEGDKIPQLFSATAEDRTRPLLDPTPA